MRLETNVEVSDVDVLLKINEVLRGVQGPRQVIVRLASQPVSQAAARGASLAEQNSELSKVENQQRDVIGKALALDSNARVLATVQKALNAVLLEIDASALYALAAEPAVVSIKPVRDYEMDLSETVPYIGATALHNIGLDGAGIRVAVLDSGIDYTHFALGGSGNPADYTGNNPTIIEPGTFPTAKVVGGYDFVGNQWTGGTGSPPLLPDPDPLDDGTGAGHGTHVSDIIGGKLGVAPAADLYGVKVCSSVSTACSGVALIQGMDFALDPNNDGDVSDHVDVVNMSLGSLYGQAFDDDLSTAVNNATAVGVLSVTAAGNGSDKPYVLDTPSAELTAMSVAQTSVPSAVQPVLTIVSPASISGDFQAVFQPWSAPLTTLIEAPVQYGDGAGGNLNGCAAFAPGLLAGKIVLVDRGVCNFSDKISNIATGNGLIGIIGLIAPGDPFEGGFGGGTPPTIPGYMISQALSNRIKSQLATGVTVRFDPASGIPLVMHMVGSSSRGPAMLTNLIKPDIGAPGASVSAIVGTGTGTGPFGGTSGATPMVSGSAALLMQAFPDRKPSEIKSLLMNTAETNIMNSPAFFGGRLAPITRIGGGEVRVDRAYASPAAAWDAEALTGSLSFGFYDVTQKHVNLYREVMVKNYTDHGIWYNIQPTFRFDEDANSGAVEVKTPRKVFVPAHKTAKFKVLLTVRGNALPAWAMNSGSLGSDGNSLTGMEFDGYIWLVDAKNADNNIHLAWQVLPRKSGNVQFKKKTSVLTNKGVGTTTVESYSLIGVSDNLPEGGMGEGNPTPDLRYVGYATFPVPAGFCGPADSFVMAFAANTWERQTHANAPASFEFDLDVDQDGTFDYEVFTFDFSLSGSISDGRNLTWVVDLSTGIATAFFFTDHETNSGNTVLLFCGDQIGMDATDFFTPIDITAGVRDWYNSGHLTDQLTGITIAPLGEQFLGVFDAGGVGATTLGPGDKDKLTVLDYGPLWNNTETGLLMLNRNGAPENNEAWTVIVKHK
jgi:subtilisin family serine protease